MILIVVGTLNINNVRGISQVLTNVTRFQIPVNSINFIYPSGACIGGFPCNTIWKIDANGLHGYLVLNETFGNESFTGHVFNNPVNGSWDENSKQIKFTEWRANSPNFQQSFLPVATYTGYLSYFGQQAGPARGSSGSQSGSQSVEGPPQPCDENALCILAGSFTDPLKHQYGWAAIPATEQPNIPPGLLSAPHATGEHTPTLFH